MDDLQQLEYLQLVSKVTNELENHTGLNDKTLAEFIISKCRKSKSLEKFKQKLDEIESNFPLVFIESVYRLVELIPIKKKKKKVESVVPASGVFKALEIKDDPERIAKMMQEELNSAPPSNARDQDESKKIEKSSQRDSYSNGRDDRDRERSLSQRDEKRKASRTIESGRRKERKRGVVAGEIYEGKIVRIKEYGAFCELLDVGRETGLIHISGLADRRVAKCEDVVSVGDVVFVKVQSIKNEGGMQRYSLSMKEVDQSTGKELDHESQTTFSEARIKVS